jgi:hypothetical protein
LYWFYKNWQRVAEREGDIVWPAPRALFGLLYCYSLFTHIRDDQDASQLDSRLPALPLAIGFIVTTLTWRLPDPWGWISMLSFLFLLPVQHYANRLNALAVPSHDRNSRFGVWNWVAVLVGGGLMLSIIAGAFLGPEV